jgi:hypothetical protein
MARIFLLLGGVLFMGQAASAVAADTESRDFTIFVDGTASGQHHMTINRRDDGTVTMSAQANVRVKKVLITLYNYTYTGTEVWKEGKDGRLLSLTSTSNDNGKRFDVQANPDSNGLRVRVNGQERLIRADAWTTTYWKLADARFHNQAVPLLDADTGKDFNGRLNYLGAEQISVTGQVQNCYHFRVTGGPNPVDLWYDAQHRLVRQEFTEDGHRTILQLAAIRR